MNTARQRSPRAGRRPSARATAPAAVCVGLPEARHLLQLSPAWLDRQRHPAPSRTDRVTYKPLLDVRRPIGETIGAAAKSGLQGRGAFALARQVDTGTTSHTLDDLREPLPLPTGALLQV